MGFFLSKTSNLDNVNKNRYLFEAKDIKALKKFWIVIENDPSYYGWIFSGILFRNHPQYVKYFHDKDIPEFVEDAKIRKKFSAVCSINSVLFINYLKKPNQRDYVLGYIAMIHKDMQLSSQDLENFMIDFVDMLTQERPEFMNSHYRNLIVEYFGGLMRRIDYLMEVYRNRDFCMIGRFDKFKKRNRSFKSWCSAPTIYGSPIEFWIAKKKYWQNKLAILSPVHENLTGLEKDDNVHRVETVKFNFSKGTNHFFSQNRNNSLNTTSDENIDTTNSESPSNNFSSDDARTRKKNRRHYVTSNMLSTTTGPMEVIPEASSSLINAKSPPRRKSSPKKTREFLDAVEALKTTSAHSEADRSSNESSIKRIMIIDTARERKRARDKKFKAMHSTSNFKQIMDSNTLITSKAEKFAQALEKRRSQ